MEIDGSKEIYLGQVVNNKDEAYNLYQEHAFKTGFSVRKGRELYYDNGKKQIRLKELYCSKQDIEYALKFQFRKLEIMLMVCPLRQAQRELR
jgi:hypothetical protein